MADLVIIITIAIVNLNILACGFLISKNYFNQLYIVALGFVSFLIFMGYISAGQFELSLVFITFSNFLCLLSLLVVKKINYDCSTVINKKSDDYSYVACIILSLASLGFLVQGAGGLNALLGGWIDVKDELDHNDLLRNTAMFFYVMSVASLRSVVVKHGIKLKILIPILLITLFVLALRVKLFMLPLFLAVLLPSKENKLDMRRLVLAGILFPVLYVFVMVFRWLGNLQDAGVTELLSTIDEAFSAGIEREMYHQFSSIYEYYQQNQITWGAPYLRLLFLPFDYVFGTSVAPDNPMYEYYTIQNYGIVVEGGSAHPSLYGDSFASFGIAGVFIPAIIIFMLNWMYFRFNGKSFSPIVFVGVMIFIGLVTRGAVFYAFLYLMLTLIAFFLCSGIFIFLRNFSGEK